MGDDSERAKDKQAVLKLIAKNKTGGQKTQAIAQARQPTNATGRQQSLGAGQESSMLNKIP